VIRGELLIRLRSEEISLTEGEFFIVPRGVEHLPVAHKEAWVLLFELKSTRNTGNLTEQRTRTDLERI
jgi:quercetin dioxygenase-like cupin family protein